MLDIFLAFITNPNIVALLNFVFLSFIIVVGALLGSTLRIGKETRGSGKKLLRSNRIGIGSAFICVPFIASFLHLNYNSLLLPLKESTPAVFVEQLFMLISLAGIASYLGYGLLDNIASKVLQSQVNEIGLEQKEAKSSIESLIEENKKIKENEENMRLELKLMQAKDYVQTGQKYSNSDSDESKLASSRKYNEAIELLNEGLRSINPDTNYRLYDKYLVLKAYTLKRIGDIPQALEITKKLLEKDQSNPIHLYNVGCYLMLCDKEKIEDVKNFIIKSLTVTTGNDTHRQLQEKLIAKVLTNADEDIRDLFDDAELASIRQMTQKR